MGMRISLSSRIALSLLVPAAWGLSAAPQADSPAAATKRPPAARQSAAKANSARNRASKSTKSRNAVAASSEGPAALLQKHFDAAQAAEQQGDFVRAESEYRQALGMALGELGETSATLGDLGQAEAAFQGAVQATANSDAALLGLAVVYLRKGEFQRGVDTVRTLLAQKPTHPQARQLLGKLYFSMNRFDAASLELQEARRLDPEDTETLITLAFTYLRQKQLQKAQKIFADLLQQHGESPQIHITFGAAYRESEYVNESVSEFQKAAALDNRYPRLHYYLALAYLSQEGSHGIPQALAELSQESRLHPDEYSAQYLTGLIYQQQRKLDEALPYLEKAETLDPANPDAPLYLGQALYLLDQTDRGVSELQKSIALTKDPTRNQYQISKAYYLIGQYLNRQGKLEEAKQQLALAEKYKALATIEDQQRLRIYLGSGMGGRDDLSSAVPEFEGRAVIIGPPPPVGKEREKLETAATFFAEVSGQAYNQLGLLRARESDFEHAAHLLTQAQKWRPDLPGLQFNLGLARFKMQDYAAAEPPLEKALAEHPERQDVRTLLGLSCFFHEDYRRAAEVLVQLQQSGDDDPQVAYALGLSLVYAAQRERGVAILRGLVDKYPRSADVRLAMGQALAVGEEYNNAAAEFSKALELDPAVPQGHYYLGLALLRREQFADAAAEFRHEITMNPQNAKAQYHLGLALTSLNDTEAAAAQFNTAIRLDASYADAYYELGKAQLKQGKIEDAITNLEKASQLESDKSYVQYQLSQAYLKAGKNDAAQSALARYRELKAHERPATAGSSPETP
jgi:tetratricopeptide (TPR) repeat protein